MPQEYTACGLHLEFITIHFEARTGRLTALGAWQVSDVEQDGASAKRWERRHR